MDQIDKVFHTLCNAASFFKVVAAFKELRTAHAEFNWEAWANGVAHTFQHFTNEAQSVFQAAAIFVGSMIEIW